MPQKKRNPEVSALWCKLFKLLPGYDPIKTSEDCLWDIKAADTVIDWIEHICLHVKGEKGGEPFLLEPWQKAAVGALFGWKRPDGTRRYREMFFYVPRKNGKTVLAATIALFVLTMDNERGMEIYSAAADHAQASLVYAHAAGMVAQKEALSQRLKVYKTTKTIVAENTFSSYKVISAEANTKHGFNSQLVIVDETHAQPDRELVDVLTTSTGARRQPLILHTTTSDFDRPSICNEKLDYAEKVRDGIIKDKAFLPILYIADEERWQDEKEWKRCNPNLGVSKSLDYMRREFQRAMETPAYENTFKRLELNIKTRVATKWLDLGAWDKGAEPIDVEALRGRTCYGGLDLGSTSDLTSLCLLFPEEVGYQALWYHWCPKDTAHRRKNRDRVDYLQWAAENLIELTPGNETDYRLIRNRIQAIADRYGMIEIAVDRLFQGAQLCQDLVDDMGEDHVIPFGMGYYSMAAPTQELERLVNRGELQHGGNALVRWMVSNTIVREDPAGNLKPDKSKSAEKIDGVVSCLMALGRAMIGAQAAGPSVYETRGLRTV